MERRRRGVRVCGMYLAAERQMLLAWVVRDSGHLTDRGGELGEDADAWNGTSEHERHSRDTGPPSDRGVNGDILGSAVICGLIVTSRPYTEGGAVATPSVAEPTARCRELDGMIPARFRGR